MPWTTGWRSSPAAQAPSAIALPEPSDFDDARRNEPQCLITDEGRTFVALGKIDNFDDTFLYAARSIDPFAIEFPAQAAVLHQVYCMVMYTPPVTLVQY